MQRRPEKLSSMDVERGMYVLRYVGASGSDAPTIFVRPSPGSEGDVTVVAYPGEPASRLDGPGSICVVVVEQPATLQLTAQAKAPGGSLAAEVRLELLRREGGGVVAAVPAPPALRREPSFQDDVGGSFDILAHVARIGDVTVGEGEWIGGPSAPAPIEGIAIRCSRDIGAVEYQVMMAGDSRWSDWVSSGTFAGSRGRARALVGLRLRMGQVTDAVLEGEALFLGSVMVRKQGLDIEFRSSAGNDPLVGVRIGIKKNLPATTLKPSVFEGHQGTGRVRVFRASGGRR